MTRLTVNVLFKYICSDHHSDVWSRDSCTFRRRFVDNIAEDH